MMMVPLYSVNWDQPESRPLMRTSVNHWLSAGGSNEIFGWSRAAAAQLYAAMGDGDQALASIHMHMTDKRFIMPNTMYTECNFPVMECSVF